MMLNIDDFSQYGITKNSNKHSELIVSFELFDSYYMLNESNHNCSSSFIAFI